MRHTIACTTCGTTGDTVAIADTVAGCDECGATWAISTAQVGAYRTAIAARPPSPAASRRPGQGLSGRVSTTEFTSSEET